MNRKTFLYCLLAVTLIATLGLLTQSRAVESWTQTLMMTIDSGASAKGAAVLQTGEVSTLSAVSSSTRAMLVAAPAAGSIYLRGIWIEKAATTTGSIVFSYGTGTACATGTTTLLSLVATTGQTFPFGYQPVGIQVPATKELCVTTEGANTAVRALAQ